MNTSTSTSPGVMAPSNGADSSNQSTDDSTTDEFEAILNQLSALGSEIDQELSHSKRNTEQVAFAPKPTEVPTVKPIANSSTEQQFNTGTMRLKTNTSGSIGSQDSSQFYNSHVHHFSHLYHSQATENGLSSTRTDSPDNDSAFSDSISLLSSEQSSSSSCSSSSSSSSSAANRQPSNSTLCSTTTSSLTVQSAASNQQPITNVVPTSAKPTFISTSSSQQLNTNLSSNLNSSPPLPPTSPLSTSSHSSENSTLTPNNNNNSFFSGLFLDRQLSQLNHQQELFFEQLGINATPQVKPSTTSTSQLQKDSNSFDTSNQDSQQELLSISEQFKYIFNVVNIEPKRSSVIGPTGDDDNNDSSDSDDDNQSEDSELVGRSDMTLADCDNINNNGGGASVNNVTDNNINDDDDNTDNEIERNIQLAMDKIREASYRKLYLKVFAQDNSAKSLLADERMTIGTICGQLAVKNHVEMHTSLAIIEHMPHLYMERFYEDHESLVENVLLWGRESANKLYFMQRPEKYDLFVQPEKYLENSSDGTLKSRESNSGLAVLRNELIGQCFESDVVRVPQIESDLYLRVEGKKSWKKYFFSLRPSGVYYCVKGKPKSTADLLCLTTFEMNCVYYGFGWKKKFKAPYDYGFAIKHPQQQTKSHKQIKYLCAHSEDQLRLWMTGIRIAKYGRTLLDNYTQFGQSGTKMDNTIERAKPMYNSLPEPDSHHLPTESNSNPQSVTMRPNRITRDESSRSSSTSSSSGCMSEGGQSSVVSTPSTGSGHSSVSNPTNRYMPQQLSNGTLSPPPFSPHHHHQLDTHPSVTSLQYLSSPNHHSHQYPTQHSIQQSSVSLNAFEADFPTIKRKPSMPKIPLTNTTRNLALQSDDALLEVNENGSAVDANGFTEEELYGSGMSASPSHGDFTRGTFKTGTLRRSTTDERMKGKMSISSPMHHINYLQPPPPSSIATKSDSEDELPPPPPPPCGLKESESVQSLNSSFPPPPPEMMSSPTPPPLNSMSQPPQPLPHLHHVSMTPQPQPKNPSNSNRLSRRLSDLSPNSATYLSYRHAPLNDFPGCSTMPHMMPNTRASIATSSGLLGQNEPVLGNSSNSTSNLYSPQTGFATLKPYHSRAASGSGLMTNGSSVNGRFQRQLTLDLHSINKYGTAPRIRNEPFMAQLAHQQQLQQQQHHLQSHCTNEFGAPAAVPNTYESFRASTNNYGGGPSCIAAGMQPSTAHFMDNNKQSTSPHYHTTGAILNGSHSASSVHNVYGSAAAAATGSGATLGGEKINEMPQLMTQQQQQPIMSPPVPPHQHHHHHQHMAEPQGIPPPSHYGIPPSKTSSQYPPSPSPHQPQTVSSVAGMHAHILSPQIDCCNQAILLDRTGYHNNNNSSSGNMIAPSGISNSSGVSRSAPLSTPPPPPQPQPQLASLPPQATVPQHSPGVIQTGAITTIPSNKENIIYMSISPHLLQKHQQMQRHQRQPQHHHQNGSDIYGAQMYGSQQAAQHQIYQVPPEQIFLKNMERVMQKKWHVAQMLTQENHAGATPGQVLGFRDAAYLPPRDDGTQGVNQQQTQFANYAPQPQSPHLHNIPHYHINQVPQSPTYNGTVQYDSQAMYGAQQAKGKSVRILDSPTIIGHAPESPNHYSPSQQQIYGMGVNGAKRVPPPPPRRSENTHLTTNNNSNTSSSRR